MSSGSSNIKGATRLFRLLFSNHCVFALITMKVFVVAVCLLAIGIVSAKEIHQYEVSLDEFIESNIRFMERQKKITANINDYMDNILLRASKFFVMKGYDPLQVDDKIEGFSVVSIESFTFIII